MTVVVNDSKIIDLYPYPKTWIVTRKRLRAKLSLYFERGERIPRKPLEDYSEADSLWHAFSRDGFWRTAMNDKNQYGPVAMMILLIIVATITGLGLKILSLVI